MVVPKDGIDTRDTTHAVCELKALARCFRVHVLKCTLFGNTRVLKVTASNVNMDSRLMRSEGSFYWRGMADVNQLVGLMTYSSSIET